MIRFCFINYFSYSSFRFNNAYSQKKQEGYAGLCSKRSIEREFDIRINCLPIPLKGGEGLKAR